jgi:hypothetical protein
LQGDGSQSDECISDYVPQHHILFFPDLFIFGTNLNGNPQIKTTTAKLKNAAAVANAL